jgi:Tol biopolymer transport system component
MDPNHATPMSDAPAVFNLEDGQSEGLTDFIPKEISPDGKVIITEFNPSSWVFQTESGQLSYPIPTTMPLKKFTHMFLPGDQLLLEGTSLKPENHPNGGDTRDMYVFSLDTGKLTFLQSIFLPYSVENPLAIRNNYSNALYSPDLKFVIYPADYQGIKISILLSIQNQKVVWYGWPGSDLGFLINPLADFANPPIWRPDSSGIILDRTDDKTGIRNFYNLSIDGQVSQLTHLEQIFPSSNYVLSSPTISPDGRYLAFVVTQDAQTFPSRNSSLWILDLKTGTILNPCITLANGAGYPNFPVWSPDSNAIAVVPDAGGSVLAVDLNRKIINDLFSKIGLTSDSLKGWVNWQIP